MNEKLQAALAVETNVDALRGLVLIADAVIEKQAQKLESAGEVIDILVGQLNDAEVGEDRYQLLKLMLPDMLQIAASAGAQSGGKAVELFGTFDTSKLDSQLDALIDASVLDDAEAKETITAASNAGIELED